MASNFVQKIRSWQFPLHALLVFTTISLKRKLFLRDFILSQTSLNITPFKDANINDNHIYLIELQQPSKDEAIKFLDNNGLKPERVARVVVFFGRKLSPEVREYLVSPAAKPSLYKETTEPGHKYPIPYEARPEDSKELDATESFILKMSEQLRDLFYESFDGWVYLRHWPGIIAARVNLVCARNGSFSSAISQEIIYILLALVYMLILEEVMCRKGGLS